MYIEPHDRSRHRLRGLSGPRERMGNNLTGAERRHRAQTEVSTMAKRGRKKKDRKYSKANHGKRPNC
jgi:hypothetical protein